jgi:hypothetical protein
VECVGGRGGGGACMANSTHCNAKWGIRRSRRDSPRSFSSTVLAVLITLTHKHVLCWHCPQCSKTGRQSRDKRRNKKVIETDTNKKFWEELMAYFPLIHGLNRKRNKLGAGIHRQQCKSLSNFTTGYLPRISSPWRQSP